MEHRCIAHPTHGKHTGMSNINPQVAVIVRHLNHFSGTMMYSKQDGGRRQYACFTKRSKSLNMSRKRKINMSEWNDIKRKKLRDSGKPYNSRKGKEVPGKTLPNKEAVKEAGVIIVTVDIEDVKPQQSVIKLRGVHMLLCSYRGTAAGVFNLPPEVPNSIVTTAFTRYDVIHSVRNEQWSTAFPFPFNNSIRALKMEVKHNIPDSVPIAGYNAHVTYFGQPILCFVCHKPDHKKEDCPRRKTTIPVSIQ
ncbi:hypothetical protein ANN_10982 [Periplaneta americana]|uniref:CCHC-type domain-containing protein n=1 Tax=Periplaneta americana TaxID=6978 RepID=A0ABQ8T3R8_PERAM|nr:hypothetical protein ANN_10982 [Periplaneta americana]